MGMSADATLAWGVATGDNDEDPELRERIETLLEEDWELEKLFGWTEKLPAPVNGDYRDPGSVLAREAYQARKQSAIPVEFGYFGSYDYGGKVLFIKRTYTNVNWGVDEVDPVTLDQPTADELSALNKVLDAIGFQGDRMPKLLLFAMYG